MIRIEMLTPKQTIMTAEAYNQVFTLHGAIMVFLFIIPSVPAALGNFVLPLMLGAKDVAFPRLNLLSFYIYFVGALMAVCSIVMGGVDTGWTFYTPYSTTTGGAVGLMVLAAFVLGFSSIFTGLNFIATIHKLRAPGMGWFQMPLFVWSMYATALIQVMATPVLGHHAAAAVHGARLPRRHLRSETRRRSGAVPALLLVLLAPGRVHHDRSRVRDHLRDHSGVLEEDDLRLSGHRVLLGRDRGCRLPGVGPPHVRERPVDSGRRDLLVPDVPGRDSVRRQGIQLAGDDVPRLDRSASRRCCTRCRS